MSRPPKCLYIMPDFSGGGPERVSLELLNRLPSLGIETDLLLFRDLREDEGKTLAGTRVLSVLDSDEKISRHPLKFLTRFLKIARNYDVLIAVEEADPWPIYFVAVAGFLLRKKVVWAVHTCMSRYLGLRKSSKSGAGRTRLLSRLTSKIVAVSGGVRDDLIENLGISSERIEVIYNPNDLSGIQSLSQHVIPAEDEHLFAKPVVLAVNHLTRLKGCDLLISAARMLKDKDIDCNIVILGSGDEEGLLRKMSSDLGVDDMVFMPGFRKNPYPYMARSSAFVLASRLEALPTVVIEAMACSCPVIAADCMTGPSEILDGGKYGTLVGVEDAEGIAASIEELLLDGKKREFLAEAGRTRSRDFDGAIAVKRYAEVLLSL